MFAGNNILFYSKKKEEYRKLMLKQRLDNCLNNFFSFIAPKVKHYSKTKIRSSIPEYANNITVGNKTIVGQVRSDRQ